MKRIGIKRETIREKLEKADAVRMKVLDDVKFIRSWAQNPLRTGAVAPSGPELAARMVSFLTPRPHARVVELGPGTGVVTKALFEAGFSNHHLNLIEYSADFCDHLEARYPGLPVLQGDAYALRGTLSNRGGFLDETHEPQHSLDGIVSSLPLLTRPEKDRKAFLSEALDLLKPGAPLIQFSYGLAAPVKPKTRAVSIFSSEWIWKNLPPARVWVYRKAN
ncbi:class I SAM-dependent methyltransferase [Labrenzia sp. PHM005]|uniref:class I SAM-dependent methyltransferase n=1 Tax=Labrenzia sp. PHM005 TaxID=2590016 RepID=UPI00113FF69C|nr:methyltransferase domain-containing protein [Labrenzia sp. PHM005]QDG74779.1 methyltransferase domain-containing protein [Labrenzia sp. PHM005]